MKGYFISSYNTFLTKNTRNCNSLLALLVHYYNYNAIIHAAKQLVYYIIFWFYFIWSYAKVKFQTDILLERMLKNIQ